MVEGLTNDDSNNNGRGQHKRKMAVFANLAPDVLFGVFLRKLTGHSGSLAAVHVKSDVLQTSPVL